MRPHFFKSEVVLKRRNGGCLTYWEEFPGGTNNPLSILQTMIRAVEKSNKAYHVLRITTKEIGGNVK